ncbi:unnamed protein product [Rotaria magnacalcarata]|uniref:RNA-directed DNA polymerase n=1 Tax=Rotaria magnacalcarata TaxID=392030 RepID=A0A816B9P2_9BILA|nr:unnamed protein product [Rotaria magnacalcarata]
MFDTGSTKSFINKTALARTKHLPLDKNKQQYVMADGYTKFEVNGTVKIFIELNHIKTNIIVGVVNSLCMDCILGMDYLNKYKINLNNKHKQVQIYTPTDTTTLPMENHVPKTRTVCRLVQFIYLGPYQERKVKIRSSVFSGQLLFSPAYRLLKIQGLMITHSLICFQNYETWISIYNPTYKPCYLYENAIVGVATSLDSSMNISTVLNLNIKEKNDNDYTHSLTNNSEHNIHTLSQHMQDPQQLNDLIIILNKHHPLFDTSTITIAETPTPHTICTGDNPPTTSRPYPQTIEKQNATFDIIQQMLKHKQIRASHSQYSAPILLIKKRDGAYRFIVDYRKLNNITIQDNYPLPNLEQTIQMVGGHQYYTKLDLRSGYFQIPILDKDKHKTAFITVHGLYEFNVLAQGLKNSPPSFQRIMSNLLLPCKNFCLVYLDDILVYSDSFHQHLNHLNQVLAILNKHKFQLNPQKCELAKRTIDYLGHTISTQGVKPLQERIEKILNIPQPTSLHQANAFIGAIGWYRKFIKDYTKIAAPILAVTNLTKQNKFKFKWDTPQKEAFNQLKIAITSQPLFLTYPDPNEPLILSTDASDYCIGGVLYQEINGERKNIYFHSQMLPKSQRKWPTIEKEALGIYYSITRMKLYLLGREFIVQTDHCPLRDIHKKPSNNRRVDRISLVLQQYNIKEIRHVSVDKNKSIIPSFISAVTTRAQARAQAPHTPSNNDTQSLNHESITDDLPQQEAGHEFDITTIAEAQKGDKLYKEKILEINKNPLNCFYVLENDILYKINNRGIFQQKLIYIPASMIQQILNAYHNSPWAGHFGDRRTYSKLKDKYWWPNMKITIQNYIQTCMLCQQFNINRKKPVGLLHPIEPPKGPCQLIGMDYSGPFPTTPEGNKYVLAITDYFTKWVIAIPLPNQTALTTAEVLYEHYICIYGVPHTILSDQGPHFNNQLITAFTQILGYHHIKSTPYHPQTNGAIERFNSTFERQIAKLTDQCVNNWDMHLKSVVFAYNTGQHATTKFSPYELQFGRQPKLPPEKSPTSYEFSKPNDYFQFLQQTLKIYQQQAYHNMKKNQQYYKQKFDANRQDRYYNVGDLVLKRFSTFPSKLAALYSHPMIVIEQQHPTYFIQDQNDQQIYRVHVSQLRPCKV